MKEKTFNYIYKITNTTNNMIYIGVHCTDNLDDGYMGSGTKLQKAIQEIGIEHFKKEILEYFDTWQDALDREEEIVNKDFIKREDTYNSAVGGGSYLHTRGTVLAKYNGKIIRVPTDEFYKNRDKYETFGNCKKGYITCYDIELDKYISVKLEDFKNNRNRYKTLYQDKVLCIDENGNKIFVDKEEYSKGKYKSYTFGKVTVKDSEGKTYCVDKNDPQYLSGELVPIWQGRKHSEETKQKMRKSRKGYNIGEKNSHYGHVWIYNSELKQNKSIKKEELEKYISEGWIKGRKEIYRPTYIPKPKKIKRCSICGKEAHKDGYCKSWFFRNTKNIEKLGFDISKIGTIDVFIEYDKLKNKIYQLYWIENASIPKMMKMFNIPSERTFELLFKFLDIKTREKPKNKIGVFV